MLSKEEYAPEDKQRQKRLVRLSHNKNYRSVVLLIILVLILATSLGSYCFFFYIISAKVDKLIEVEKFYFQNYILYSGIHDLFLAFSFNLIYGNFYSVNGNPVDFYLNGKYINNFISFWTNPSFRIEENFGQQNALELKEFLFDNSCKYLLPERPYHELIAGICQRVPGASKGFISFLNYELDNINQLVSQIREYPDFLESTKQTAALSPLFATWYRPEQVEFRLLHAALLQSGQKLLFHIIDSSLTARIQSIQHDSNSLNLIILISIMILPALLSWMVVNSWMRDKAVLLHSFTLYTPSTLLTNPFVHTQLKRYFTTDDT